MSKQSEAKKAQGYVPKYFPAVCSNCAHYRSEMREFHDFGMTWKREINRQCGIGGFAVKKTATCARWEIKPTTA